MDAVGIPGVPSHTDLPPGLLGESPSAFLDVREITLEIRVLYTNAVRIDERVPVPRAFLCLVVDVLDYHFAPPIHIVARAAQSQQKPRR